MIANMKTKSSSILLASAMLLGIALLAGCKKDGATASGKKYHCPMHPTYVSDRPGDCPICNMKLVEIKDGPATPAATKPKKDYNPKIGQYFCPMKCDGSISDQPGECPECGMKLLLLDENRAKEMAEKEAADAHAGHTDPVPGRVTVAVSPEKRHLIGLKTATVESRELTVLVRAQAVVEHDETRYARIAPRFNGWVKDLKVNYTGQEVEKGQPLFSVYSPDLLAGESEYLLAWRNYRQMLTNNTAPAQVETARRLVDSARKRLELWQIGDQEIRAIEDKEEIKDEMIFRAPFTGHVTAKMAVEGKAFMAGESLYEIADLSHLWLRASIFERDWPLIKLGQSARVIFPYLANKTLESSITFLYPHIDPLTRRGEVRLELDNPGHALRPDMWASVEVEVPLGRMLVAPASAIIDTGLRHVAFVDRADGHLEPREVKIGARTDDYWQVLEGLKEGEKVATRALFLVDSESQLKAAIAGMTGDGGGSGGHQH